MNIFRKQSFEQVQALYLRQMVESGHIDYIRECQETKYQISWYTAQTILLPAEYKPA